MVQQIFFEDVNRVAIRSVADPEGPVGHEVLVRPAYVGICGTDLHVLKGKHTVKPPLVIGHEMSGVVESVGLDVSDLEPGMHVVVNPVVACGKCDACRRGRFNICESASVIGFRRPGVGQTKMIIERKQLHVVPQDLGLDLAALAEPLSVGVHAAKQADDLSDVLVIGCGTIGLCTVLALKALGAASITVVEPQAEKRALARLAGADIVQDVGEPLTERRYTTCFDVVASPATMKLAENSCLSGGTIVIVGTPLGVPDLNIIRLQRFEMVLKGSCIFNDDDMAEAIQLLSSRQETARHLVTNVRSLSDAAAAYEEALLPENVKTLIRMNER